MQTIYEPSGRAKEYGELALNIYTGCPHGCVYCYAPLVLKKDRKTFHSCVEPRKNIVEETKKRLAKGDIKDKLIHLCFTCDPYPTGYDTSATREIIEAIKNSGNHVQILTKGGYAAGRDFDLLDRGDKFGITFAGKQEQEPNAAPDIERMDILKAAWQKDIFTWVSCEPVYYPDAVYQLIAHGDFIDLFKIGKLNYAPSDINWTEFGRECERLCKKYERNYYIKEDLRKLM